MTTIRIYNDTWDGAFHAHRAATALPTRTTRGWLDDPITPGPAEDAGEPAATVAAPSASGANPVG